MSAIELQTAIKDILKNRLSQKGVKAFVFGSSLRKKKFYDVDIGLIGDVDKTTLSFLKEDFEESNLPYKVDVVNFNAVDEAFRHKVFNEKIVWLHC